MKRVVVAIISVLMILSAVACGDSTTIDCYTAPNKVKELCTGEAGFDASSVDNFIATCEAYSGQAESQNGRIWDTFTACVLASSDCNGSFICYEQMEAALAQL